MPGFRFYKANVNRLKEERKKRSIHICSLNNFLRQISDDICRLFCFLINYQVEISLYVMLKDRMSNSIDPDETAHLDLRCLQKLIKIVCGSERDKLLMNRLSLYQTKDNDNDRLNLQVNKKSRNVRNIPSEIYAQQTVIILRIHAVSSVFILPQEEPKHHSLSKMRIVKILIRLRERTG